MNRLTLCVHAHFFQPPRAHPVTGVIGTEKSAAPFRNWNERAHDEVYRPNAEANNFDRLSFDAGEALLAWLEKRTPSTYQHIIRAATSGNALAAPLHQSPLPLLSERDRLTQLRWGAQVAKKRFGNVPQGVFLPYFAADEPTLQAVVDAGFAFTLLRASQVDGLPRRGGSGPYRITLASGDDLTVFVVNDVMSHSMIEEMVERGGAGYWARRHLLPYCRSAGALTVIYVDGEMLGQHKMAEAQFIHYLLRSEAQASGFQPTTITQYYRQVPQPLAKIELLPYQPEEPSDAQRFLYAALRALMTEATSLLVEALGDKAWLLRDRLFEGGQPEAASHKLLTSQFYLQQAWANTAALENYPQVSLNHIFNDVAYALQLIQQGAGVDLSTVFYSNLSAHQNEPFKASLAEMQQVSAAQA